MLAVLVVGGLVICGEVLGRAGVEVSQEVGREVAALSAATPDHDDPGGAGNGVLCIGRIIRPGDLSDVIARRGGRVHGDVGLGVIGVVVADPAVRRIVDGEAGVLQALVEGHAVVRVDGARARAAVDRVYRIAAQEADRLAGVQRQGVVVVLQQDGALALDLGDNLLGSAVCLGAATILGFIVAGIPVLGTLRHDGLRRAPAQVVVEKGAEHARAHVQGDRKRNEHDCGHDLDDRLLPVFRLGLLGHWFSCRFWCARNRAALSSRSETCHRLQPTWHQVHCSGDGGADGRESATHPHMGASPRQRATRPAIIRRARPRSPAWSGRQPHTP